MALAGVLLAFWRRDRWQFDPFAVPGEQPVLAAAAAVGVIAVVVGLSLLLMYRTALGDRCAEMIRRTFGHLSAKDCLLLAIFSGLGEELLFRGWMLNEWGLLASSIVFGAVHVPLSRDWIYWPVFAFVIGLILGAFCLWTNTLIWAVFIHVGINAINLHLIYRRPSAPAEASQ